MENNNQITDLRAMLFDQLRRLSDPGSNLDKEILRSKAIVDVGNVIVNSAKAEVEFMRITGQLGTGFIPENKLLSDGSNNSATS